MAPMKNVMGRLSAVAVVVTVVFFATPYLLGHDVSGGLSKLSIIRGAAKDTKFPEVKLADVLARAATPDKTVIITSLNEAWAERNTMIDVFLEGFRSGENITHLIDHLVVVCTDKRAYERCTTLHRHCFRMGSAGTESAGEKVFMTEGFVELMWRRIQFLGEVLELGYSFVFSDGDILWFRDPFKVFATNIDVQLSTDRYRGSLFDFNVHEQAPNSGFLYVRSNNRTIEMYKYWYEARIRNPGKNDQQVLKSILEEEEFGARVNVTVKFFNTVYFSGFCMVSRDMTRVVTMHSNCCVGLSNKLNDLHLALDDWRMYKNGSDKGNITNGNMWRAPSACKNSFERLAPWAL